MPRIIDKERAEILQSTDEFIIDSAINGTRKVSFDTLKESLGTSGGSGDGSSANIEVDGALSSSSTNPVQNKVINTAINQTLAAAKSYTDNKVSNKMDQVTLATVATTGDYNDLKNKPTLPNLSNLAKVATSGSYNDLTDCPAIPEVPTLVSELTNDVGYITGDELPVLPEVPTKVSELTNDSGFITSADLPEPVTVPTKTSELTNDSGFITSADLPEPVTVPTKTSELTNDSGFITAEALPEFQNVPTKISELTNDAGYITSADVPSKVSQLTNDSSFITEEGVQSKIDTALTSVYKWKGSVANKDALPTSDNKIGDVYDTQDTGMNYGWNGASWDSLGALVSGGYTKPEGGVPKADLAEDVQQSLAKADTALQSETQPDWNATSGAAAILNKPTKLSDFNNDSNFITAGDLPAPVIVPTKVSELENDSHFLDEAGVRALEGLTGGSGVIEVAVSEIQPEDQNILLWIDVNDAPEANSQFIANTYSKEATKVGTWITGEDLFQKTIEIIGATDGAMTSTQLHKQYTEIKNMIYTIIATNGDEIEIYNGLYLNTALEASSYIGCHLKVDQYYYQVVTDIKNTNFDSVNIYVTLQYIKLKEPYTPEKAYEELNAYRASNGLAACTIYSDLETCAQIRAQELSSAFSHTRPNGSSWYTVNSKIMSGETIAAYDKQTKAFQVGATTTITESLIDAVKENVSDRENLLWPEFKTVGIRSYETDTKIYWAIVYGY